MTPKDVVAKNYECFNTGDMETFVSLYHDDVVVTINGMHRFSGTHRGIEAWVQVLSQVPARFEDFSSKLDLHNTLSFLEMITKCYFTYENIIILGIV